MARFRQMLNSPRALLFDMDGTLTRPLIDFDAIRAEIGIAGPILEAIARFEEPRRSAAHAVVDRHELDAAERSELNDGCARVLDLARRGGLPTAIITRNSRRCAEITLARHGLRFDHVFHRDNGPAKPDPESIWQACRALGVDATATWMIGDGRHDIEAARASGATGVWLSHDRPRGFDAEPHAVVATLHELADLLASHLPNAASRVE